MVGGDGGEGGESGEGGGGATGAQPDGVKERNKKSCRRLYKELQAGPPILNRPSSAFFFFLRVARTAMVQRESFAQCLNELLWLKITYVSWSPDLIAFF